MAQISPFSAPADVVKMPKNHVRCVWPDNTHLGLTASGPSLRGLLRGPHQQLGSAETGEGRNYCILSILCGWLDNDVSINRKR
jgi:hypothetical protein